MVIQIDLRDAGICKGGIHIDGQVQIFQGYGEITAAVIIVKAASIPKPGTLIMDSPLQKQHTDPS